jgi:dolichol-phosphate mannosyltransferase
MGSIYLLSGIRVDRFLKFALVGGTGVAVNMFTFWTLTSSLGMHYLVAGPIAIQAAICSNFVLNSLWTFADRQTRTLDVHTFARYELVSVGGMVTNLVLLQLLAGALRVPPMAANFAGIAGGTVWNYVLSTRWTWAPQAGGRSRHVSTLA